jgi:hypothetical protein
MEELNFEELKQKALDFDAIRSASSVATCQRRNSITSPQSPLGVLHPE